MVVSLYFDCVYGSSNNFIVYTCVYFSLPVRCRPTILPDTHLARDTKMANFCRQYCRTTKIWSLFTNKKLCLSCVPNLTTEIGKLDIGTEVLLERVEMFCYGTAEKC